MIKKEKCPKSLSSMTQLTASANRSMEQFSGALKNMISMVQRTQNFLAKTREEQMRKVDKLTDQFKTQH